MATQWLQSYPCKTKTSQHIQKSHMKFFLEATRKPKVIYTDNSVEFGKSCEELSWNHCTSTPHRSETNGIAERAVRRVKEGTSAVLLQSGLDKEWCADPWNVTAICETFEISCLMGRHHMKSGSEYHFNGPVIPSGAMFRISSHFRDKPIENTSIRSKSLAKYTPRLCIVCGRKSGNETLWSKTLKNWSRWTRLNSTPEGSMQRKC